MYNASDAFHLAVANGNPQKALLIFSDAVFTNEDINVTTGIEFHDYFNLEEDIAIGQTTSNDVSFSLFNDGRYLNDYTFGDFLATIGVLISTGTYKQSGTVYLKTNNATWIGSDTPPYVKRGKTTPAQPSFPVTAMLGYDDKVWAFSSAGRCVVYDDKTGENITTKKSQLNAFMVNKVKGWAGMGIFYRKATRMLYIYEAGQTERYEFVPLGWFTAERPKAPDTIELDMMCYDFMQKFEKDMPSASELGISYPITIGSLYKAMCNYVGVEYATLAFINNTAKITKEPSEFSSSTMRDVLKWIAEAACSNARFNRDGKLTLDWIRNTDLVLNPTDYKSFDPYWYKTKKITKLYNRGSDGSYESTQGNGDEEYLIQDNPLLKGVT